VRLAHLGARLATFFGYQGYIAARAHLGAGRWHPYRQSGIAWHVARFMRAITALAHATIRCCIFGTIAVANTHDAPASS